MQSVVYKQDAHLGNQIATKGSICQGPNIKTLGSEKGILPQGWNWGEASVNELEADSVERQDLQVEGLKREERASQCKPTSLQNVAGTRGRGRVGLAERVGHIKEDFASQAKSWDLIQ